MLTYLPQLHYQQYVNWNMGETLTSIKMFSEERTRGGIAATRPFGWVKLPLVGLFYEVIEKEGKYRLISWINVISMFRDASWLNSSGTVINIGSTLAISISRWCWYTWWVDGYSVGDSTIIHVRRPKIQVLLQCWSTYKGWHPAILYTQAETKVVLDNGVVGTLL